MNSWIRHHPYDYFSATPYCSFSHISASDTQFNKKRPVAGPPPGLLTDSVSLEWEDRAVRWHPARLLANGATPARL